MTRANPADDQKKTYFTLSMRRFLNTSFPFYIRVNNVVTTSSLTPVNIALDEAFPC